MRIVPGRRYTHEEMRAIRESPEMAGLAFQGYVWRANLDGTVSLVHWTKAHMDNEVRRPVGYVDLRPREEIFGRPPPIVKRTPQQRVQSLVNRWWEECRKAGTVPGMSDEQVSAILGREWKTGVTEITMDDVRRLAAHFLQDAENKFEASEAKKVVRTSPTD